MIRTILYFRKERTNPLHESIGDDDIGLYVDCVLLVASALHERQQHAKEMTYEELDSLAMELLL